ncbi:MAG: bifunctional folylpolyglutamate synthase/dihydrofolate synthase [Hyphomicrobiaceae bacterium]
MTADAERLGALLASLRQLYPVSIDLSLDRVRVLLSKLGAPHRKLPPVIHVAGTNGKGSVCAMSAAMLRRAGLRVHVYTSPHLVRFGERIALAADDGSTRPIGDDCLIDLLERVRSINGSDPMTFFEITTAAAFLAFAEAPADVVVLEVGLGGRLDATNVVESPAVTVITPIALDHTERLGPTLASIAGSKAGIMKPGVGCVVGPQEPEALEVIEAVASERRAPLIIHGQDYETFAQNGRLVYQAEDLLYDLPLPALRGPHQISNAGIAIAAVRRFATVTGHGKSLGEAAIAAGLSSTVWPARMTPLNGGRLSKRLASDDELWLDGGHNPAAGAVVAQTLADLEDRAPKPTWLVCGIMQHKDVDGFLSHFAGLVRGLIAVPVTGGLGEPEQPAVLAARARAVGIPATTAPDVATALAELVASTQGARRVLICGSLYLAGNVLAYEQGRDGEAN